MKTISDTAMNKGALSGAQAQEGFIPVDGGRVYYRIYGKDKAEIPMVFLHGGPGGNLEWFRKQTVLGEKHPIVFYNQLGSAGSDFARGTTLEQAQTMLTVEHYVNEVQTVIDFFGFDEFIIVGSSWGSMLAVEYVAAKQPQGLKGVVLSGPFLNIDRWCADAERLVKLLPETDICGEMMSGERMWEVVCECEKTGSYADDARYDEINTLYFDTYLSRKENAGLIGTPSDADLTEYRVTGLSVYEYMWGHSELSCIGTLGNHDSTRLLKKITVPVLYLCGEYDCATPEAAKWYQSLSNTAEIAVIGGCAHNVACERGDEFNAVIEGFAEKLKG